MRTTVTLDGDVADRIKRVAADEGITFKEALNRALRAGLDARDEPKPFDTAATAMHLRPGIDVRKAHRLADHLEDEEILRELEAGR
jgi:hypothetical protein